MAETKIEKPTTSLEAPSTEAAADAAAPVVTPSAAGDRELPDADLDKVSGGATGDRGKRRPTSTAM